MRYETTLDGLLNRRVRLEQPKSGYRVAVDTVLLAAAVPAQAGDHVLDLGCGVGGALLALACRVKGITGVGIDIQSELIEIFGRNIARNDFAGGLEARAGDVTDLPPEWSGAFDHVLANPPYHQETRHDVSANIIKQTANSEKEGDLPLWISAAARALKRGGVFTLIHRADRQEEILSGLRGSFGLVEIIPLQPKPDMAAKRVIIRARKDGDYSARHHDGLILHKAAGGYTAQADAVLRDAQALL